ncbi:MAG: 3-dehydroquinate synthase, partial [Alphaproteobacteria bacterium]|nr:3-dehydroquinate synthase [Alphaproteobacteria bacterium]
MGDLDTELQSGTDVYMQQFSVPFAYPVYFTKNMFAADNEVFIKALTRLESHRQHRFVTFIDAGVADALPNLADDITNYAQANAETIDLVAAPEIISGGEGVKNDPDLIARLQKQMLDLRIDRHSFVMAIGGGAFLDMIGYVAATTHRGLRLIRVPTTVLAQNDSGVGVKTGVNAWGSKNLLGSFAPPFAVINDSTYLASLNERDRR